MPDGENGLCQFFSRLEISPAGTVRSHKIGIAKPADGRSSVFFTSRPEITAGEAAKDSGATCVCSLSLESVVDLFQIFHTQEGP